MIGAAQAKTHRLSRGIYHMTGDAFFDANHFAQRSVALAVRVLMAAMTIGRREMITIPMATNEKCSFTKVTLPK